VNPVPLTTRVVADAALPVAGVTSVTVGVVACARTGAEGANAKSKAAKTVILKKSFIRILLL
jgi:acyl-CoA hydrolase